MNKPITQYASAQPPSRWRRVAPPLGLFALALALRLLAVYAARGMENDAATYMMNARDLAAGRLDSPLLLRFPLLFPWLVSLGVRAGVSPETAGHALNVLAGALGVVGVYMLGVLFLPRRAAVLAGVVYCGLPHLTRSGASLLTESLQVALVVWLLYFVVSGIRQRCLGRLAAAGLLLGALPALRFEGITYAVPAVAAVVFCGWPRFWRRPVWKLAALLLLVLPILAGLYPYAWLAKQQTGRWALTPPVVAQIVNVFNENQEYERQVQRREQSPGQPPPPNGEPNGPEPSESISPPRIALHYTHMQLKMIRQVFWSRLHDLVESLFEASVYLYLLLMLAGLWVRLSGGWPAMRWTRAETFLAAFFDWRLIVVFFAGVDRRYLFVVLPIMALWSGAALDALCGLAKRRKTQTVIAIVLSVVIVGATLPRVARPSYTLDVARRAAVDFMTADAKARGLAPAQAVVATAMPHYAYYAGAQWYEIFQYHDPQRRVMEGLAERYGQEGVHYLVSERWDTELYIHGFTEGVAASGLRLLKRIHADSAAPVDADAPIGRTIDIYLVPAPPAAP